MTGWFLDHHGGSYSQSHSVLGTADASRPSWPLPSLSGSANTTCWAVREERSPRLPEPGFHKRKVMGQDPLEYHDVPSALDLLSHFLIGNKSMTEYIKLSGGGCHPSPLTD